MRIIDWSSDVCSSDLPVMLEIVEALDPEARADHAGKNDRHRVPAADQEDEALHHELREERLPDAVPDRPAAVALLLEAVAFHPPRIARALDDRLTGKAVERDAAARGVPVMFGRNVEVVTGHMRDLAGAVEIADLRIGADEPAQLAALMIELVRGGQERDHAHPGKRKIGRASGRERG